MAQCAAVALRAFQDGNQGHNLEVWDQTQHAGPVAMLDYIQSATLSLAALYYELGYLEPAEKALMESVKASQETTDERGLCVALHTWGLIYQAKGQISKAFHVLQRALGRSELLCVTELQIVCCLGLARLLSMRPKARAHHFPKNCPTKLSAHRVAHRHLWNPNAAPVVNSLAYLTLAYLTLGSPELHSPELQDTTAWAKVLLSIVEVARVSQLDMGRPFASLMLRRAQNLHGAELGLALSHIVLHSMKTCCRQAQAYCRSAARCLPCAPSLWMPFSAAPYVAYILICKRRFQMAMCVNVECGALLLTIPNKDSVAFELHKRSVNSLRLAMGNLHAFASEEAWRPEQHVSLADTCERILMLARAHLKADAPPMKNPMNVLSLALRCLAIAEGNNLRQSRAEALVLVARVKYEMEDPVTALQMLDDLQVDIAMCSAKVVGEALVLNAEILVTLSTKVPDSQSMLLHAIDLLESAIPEFQKVEDYDDIQFSAYLLARIADQLNMFELRNRYALICRCGLPQAPSQADPHLIPTPWEMPPALLRLGTQGFDGLTACGNFYPLSVVVAF
eukprot:GEMP01009151.1.p1 GENE.GEMP01009151.1~~GEMP01009151.1.p1  ORF type:complete len:565 (+),score=98.85 GEMP01009151.1:595-2289(+)